MSIVNTDMTRRYEWTLASEPPDSERMVLVWVIDSGGIEPRAYWIDWWFDPAIAWKDQPDFVVTHWRDVAAPDVSAGDMAGGG